MARLRYVLLAVTLVVLVGVSAVAVNVPHAFVAGDTIRADEMNANFAALEAAVTALEAAQPVVAHAGLWDPYVAIGPSAVARDVVVVSLEAPAAGVVIVTATAQAGFSGTTELNRLAVAIDDTEGGVLTGDVAGEFLVGWSAPANTSPVWIPVAIQRAFEVAGGTHTFRLEAQALEASFSGYLWSPTITATWFPVGSVSVATAVGSSPVAPPNAP